MRCFGRRERGGRTLGIVVGLVVAIAACSSGTDGSRTTLGFSTGGDTGATGWGVVPTAGSDGVATTASAEGGGVTGSPDDTSDAESVSGDESPGSSGEASCPNWVTALSLPAGPGNEAREFQLGPQDTLLGIAFTVDGSLLFALDQCDGAVVHEQLAGDDNSLSVGDVAVDGSRMFVSGGIGGLTHVLGLTYARATGFEQDFAETIATLTDNDQPFDIGVADNGTIWVGGTVALSTSPTAAAVRGNSAGGFCSFPAGSADASFGRAVATNGDDVYLFGGLGDEVYTWRYDADCTCADCEPVQAGVSFGAKGEGIAINDTVVINGEVIFAGWLGDDIGSFRALLGSLDDVGNGHVRVIRDLTADGDAYQQVATDGVVLYAAGATEVTTLDALEQGSAVLEVFSVPLLDDAVPISSFATADVANTVGLAVAPEGEDGVFIAGGKDGEAFVVRCDKSRGCG